MVTIKYVAPAWGDIYISSLSFDGLVELLVAEDPAFLTNALTDKVHHCFLNHILNHSTTIISRTKILPLIPTWEEEYKY